MAMEFLILALDSGETDVRWTERALADYAGSWGCYVDGARLRDSDTDRALFTVTSWCDDE